MSQSSSGWTWSLWIKPDRSLEVLAPSWFNISNKSITDGLVSFFIFAVEKTTHFPIRLRNLYPPTHENNPEFYIFIVSCEFFFFVDIIRFFNIFAVFYAAIIQPLNRKGNKMFGIRNEANLFWWNNRESFVYFFHQFLNSSFVKNGVFSKKR